MAEMKLENSDGSVFVFILEKRGIPAAASNMTIPSISKTAQLQDPVKYQIFNRIWVA
jgi:hypothetical protein